MNKTFSFEESSRSFLKSYLTFLSPIILVVATLSFQLFSTKFEYKIEAFAGLWLTAILVILILGFTFYNKYSNVKYVVSDRSIQVFDHARGEVKDYPFSQLEGVKFPKEKELKKLGKQSFTLKFGYQGKLTFTSILPYYPELRNEVMKVLAGWKPIAEKSTVYIKNSYRSDGQA